MHEELQQKTITCLRALRESHKLHGGFRDNLHIFGVMVKEDKLFPKRNGMILFGPSNPEVCQAFILGVKESLCRREGQELTVDWVNLKDMLRKLQHYELLNDL